MSACVGFQQFNALADGPDHADSAVRILQEARVKGFGKSQVEPLLLASALFADVGLRVLPVFVHSWTEATAGRRIKSV